ncbi:MAG: transposase, partial [Arenimonas sp.]
LVQLNSQEPLTMVIQRFKAHLTRSFNLKFQTSQTLWQPGFHDHALRSESDLLEVARYIVMNPIRAKLCKRVGDYPFWNAVWF